MGPWNPHQPDEVPPRNRRDSRVTEVKSRLARAARRARATTTGMVPLLWVTALPAVSRCEIRAPVALHWRVPRADIAKLVEVLLRPVGHPETLALGPPLLLSRGCGRQRGRVGHARQWKNHSSLPGLGRPARRACLCGGASTSPQLVPSMSSTVSLGFCDSSHGVPRTLKEAGCRRSGRWMRCCAGDGGAGPFGSGGPPRSPCRRRPQTTPSCCGQEPWW